MPFIEMDQSGIKEPKPVPNSRYDVVITGAELGVTKTEGKPQFKFQLAIEGHDDAPNVWHYVGIPSMDDEPKKRDFKGLLLNRFLTLFGYPIDPRGYDTDDIVARLQGARANVELVLEEYEGNVSNKLKVPPIRDAESAGRGSPPKAGSKKTG